MKKRLPMRQGDVLILPVKDIPEGLAKVKRDAGRIVLAYGETTGHAHAIKDRGADLFGVEEMAGQELQDRFLQVLAEGGVNLVHEEHSTIPIPPGNYVIRRQREYAPEALRQVTD